MEEKFLHYIWKFKKFDLFNLYSTSGKKIEIIHSGFYNTDSGPDFSLVKILIDGTEWIGNAEIHVKSSDWVKHKHEQDPSYSHIVLHIVYENDKILKDLETKNIPTLELKPHIPDRLINQYNNLRTNPFNFIPCEQLFINYFKNIQPSFTEKLFINKLQKKCERISDWLKSKNNDWEAVLGCLLGYTFGLKINAEAFERIFLSIDYKIIRKISSNPFQLEALFLGLTHNLEDTDDYSKSLKKEFQYLKSKFNLPELSIDVKYLRLRPANFPTIRLSQLANLLSQYQNLFSYIVGSKSIEHYFKILDEVKASSYWNNHYTFNKFSTKNTEKKLSKAQKELIILNAFLPIKFAYSLSIDKSMDEEILDIISQLPVEKNSIIDKFSSMGVKFKSALDSQAFLYLYKNNCQSQHCLNCEIGFQLLK